MFRNLLFIVCLAAPVSALAHAGPSVDKYGCHKDRRQGGYHCHRGPLKDQSFASQMEMLKELHRVERQDEAKRKSSPWEGGR